MKPDEIASHRFVLDLKATQDLRTKMQQDPKAGLKETARQFESMFLQMVMKSMRDATPSEGLFESDASRFYTTVLDQQMSSQLGATGQLGFARLIEAQLARNFLPPESKEGLANNPDLAGQRVTGINAPDHAAAIVGAARNFGKSAGASKATASESSNASPSVSGNPSSNPSPGAQEFANRLWPHAVEASRSTGIPAHFLIAHAALETGWGKSEIRRADGSTSHNLFGIKAGRSWKGESVDTLTTEYIDGAPRQQTERFRAYSSYAEAFRDYAALLANNPRFSAVLNQQDGTGFARALQQSGYATDPMYADKLSRIISGNTLRQALSG